MLNHYLKEVLGIRSIVLPPNSQSKKATYWIATDQKLNLNETDLLEKMLRSVQMDLKSFKVLDTSMLAESKIEKQDFVLWFADQGWSYQEAQIVNLPAFKNFFELSGDALKDLKKATWENLKTFAQGKINSAG